MKKVMSLFLAVSLMFTGFSFAFAAVSPSTWAAVDGLGRALPPYEETGGIRENKTVAMFYWTWHYPWTNNQPENNAEMLRDCPEAANNFGHPYWKTAEGYPHFWDEPLFGYYSNLDEYVLRKHAELLADADNVLGGPGHFRILLDELAAGNLADGAGFGGNITLMHITADGADPLFHSYFLLTQILFV